MVVLFIHYYFSSSSSIEFVDVAKSTLIGFVVIGLAGYLVKLIHIPINQILVGA